MKAMIVSGAILLGAVGALGCRDKHATDDGLQPGTTSSVPAPSLAQLIDSLGRVQASVVNDPSGAWRVHGADGLLMAFPRFGDTAVRPLVDCVSDTTFAKTVYNGAPVRKGLMCIAALSMVAYSEVDMSGNWPGAVLPSDTPKQLVKAGAAWRAVVEQHAYKLN